MKFDDHLAAYLYQNKQLRLEGIGTFTLDEKVKVPVEHEKEVYYPIEGLAFTYDPKSVTSESVISFLIKRLGKIEPLVRSDLEYYLSHIKQFLNIGNPYTIEGIGTLTKNNYGNYEFTPGNFLPAKEELHPKRENAEHNYPVRSQNRASRAFIVVLIVIFVLAAIGSIGWWFLSNKSGFSEVNNRPANFGDSTFLQKNTGSAENTRQTAVVSADTLNAVLADSSAVNYKMIFEITKFKEKVTDRILHLNDLHSNAQFDSIPVNDSVVFYRLFVQMKISPSDTTHVKDSLRTFFGRRIFLEKMSD